MIKIFIRSVSFLAMITYGSIGYALPILTPSSLNSGDTYQLIFVTSTTRDATSSNIADYNAFVQSAANAAWLGGGTILDGVQWSAIGSTAFVDARDNALVTGPVFNLGDELVASDFADMWNGSIPFAIRFDEYGNIASDIVWTGSGPDGRKILGLYLGGGMFDSTNIGSTSSLSSDWIDNSGNDSVRVYGLYALSGELTVPRTQIPEPAILSLFGLGLAALGLSRRKRRV